MPAQFLFIPANDRGNENLKVFFFHLAQGSQALLAVDDETWRPLEHVNFNGAAAISMLVHDLDAIGECNHNGIRKNSFCLFQIIADFSNVARNLGALKATQTALSVAGDALNECELLKIRR